MEECSAENVYKDGLRVNSSESFLVFVVCQNAPNFPKIHGGELPEGLRVLCCYFTLNQE